MFEENQPVNRVNHNAIPQWPKACGADGCENETIVPILLVRNRHGKLRAGPFSLFGYEDKKNWLLRDGYTFERWDPKCAECYQRMPDAMGISQQRGYLQHERSTKKAG